MWERERERESGKEKRRSVCARKCVLLPVRESDRWRWGPIAPRSLFFLLGPSRFSGPTMPPICSTGHYICVMCLLQIKSLPLPHHNHIHMAWLWPSPTVNNHVVELHVIFQPNTGLSYSRRTESLSIRLLFVYSVFSNQEEWLLGTLWCHNFFAHSGHARSPFISS